MIGEVLTRDEDTILDLDEAGLDAVVIAMLTHRSGADVHAALRRHADRRACGSWTDVL